MRIVSIQLRNYRVYRELNLELPGGVVGIYGANGTGKSTLLESITWALFGKARTQKQQLPSAGTGGDRFSAKSGECSATITFEHDGHHYVVKRSISGLAYTVKARVLLGDQVAADGPSDVDRYMQSVLGMDATAFRASVFAEQKQLTAFSEQTPDKRRQMVLQLLGITPVERARDKARAEARQLEAQLDKAAPMMVSMADAEAKLLASQTELAVARERETAASQRAEVSQSRLAQARNAVEALSEARIEDRLIRERGNALKASRESLSSQLTAVVEELAEIRPQAEELGELQVDAEHALSTQVMQQRVLLLSAALTATSKLGGKVAEPISAPDDEALQRAREQVQKVKLDVASLTGELRAAEERFRTAETHSRTTESLDGADGCPLCGQKLGESVERMRAHRRSEVAEAKALVDAIGKALKDQRPLLVTAEHALQALSNESARTRELFNAHVQTVAEQTVNQRASDNARMQLQTFDESHNIQDALLVDAANAATSGDESAESLRALLASLKHSLQIAQTQLREAEASALKLTTIRTRLERLPSLELNEARLRSELDQAQRERSELLARLKALNFDATLFDKLQYDLKTAQANLESASAAAIFEGRNAATAAAFVAAALEQLETVQSQHALLAEQRQRAAVLLRAGSLLHDFRQYIVGLVGPQLQIQASDLFNELTGNEYDGLEVDPDTYELRVVDHGVALPLARFSGSEVDLANLALRVAISEHVRFQSGGHVGLLVLDEALASLDADRKDQTLAALARLGGRFQQILVVTHAPEVKEQLENAIEVARQKGSHALRESSARLVDLAS